MNDNDLIYRKTAKEMFLHAPMTEDEKILVFRRLNAVPAVDAVEVVRCEDCIFWHKPLQCPMDTSEAWTSFDEYCSRGKRREEADT